MKIGIHNSGNCTQNDLSDCIIVTVVIASPSIWTEMFEEINRILPRIPFKRYCVRTPFLVTGVCTTREAHISKRVICFA
jgi:hypothetical protein